MSIFSFFNEKGGSGKSLHNVLFGSYLAYSEHKRVCVLDFESVPRLQALRTEEERLMSDKDSVLSRYLLAHPQDSILEGNGVLDIISIPKELVEPGDGDINSYSEKLQKYILDEIAVKYDYVILDLPCQFAKKSPSFIAIVSTADLVAVPFDYTPTVRRCAFNTAHVLRGAGVPLVMFWNKVSVSDLKKEGFLDKLEAFFTDRGYDVLPHRVKFFQKATRESEGRGFIVSTVCWPRRYVELNCPVLETLYACLKGRLDEITE